METTTHGPIELDAGINPPLTPGYWFNFGASVCGDTASPPMTEFTFTALPSPTTTHDGKVSMHAAHQQCGLLKQYDVCGIGLEFAQVTDLDAGTTLDAGATTVAASPCAAAPAGNAPLADGATQDAGSDGGDAASDGGDAGPPIPKATVPFDISQYKGIVFWAKATVAGDAGSLAIKVLFPDTDTDPRGGVCTTAAAGAADPADTSQCYNSYAIQQEMVTGEWQHFTVLYPDLMIATDWGYQYPSPFYIPAGGDAGDAGTAGSTKVYGINWQAQKNSVNDGGLEIEDFWVDDVYFIK
jgi:hypothetical protein